MIRINMSFGRIAAMGLCLFAAGCNAVQFTPFARRVEPVPPAPAAAGTPAQPVAHTVNAFGELGARPVRGRLVPGDSGYQQHTATDEGHDADISLDPSGQWLLFSSTRHSERSNLYMQRVDGSAVIQLTNDPADDVQPVFSPDGARIAFASTRSGSWDLYLMDRDGKNIQQLTSGRGHEMHPSFSPDGTRLVYCAQALRSQQWELWVIDLNTAARRMIGPGLFPVWSPAKDGDRIAFQRPRQRGSRWFGLWTVDLQDGEPRRFTEVASSSNAAAVAPAWSPDGRRLAFVTISGVPDEQLGVQQDLWVVANDGTGRRRLTDGRAANLSPWWGVDNRVYFISDRGGQENVWSVRADSGMQTATAGDLGNGISKDQGKTSAVPDSGALGSVDTGQ